MNKLDLEYITKLRIHFSKYQCPVVPIWRKLYENIRFLVDKNQYAGYRWIICEDLKVAVILATTNVDFCL